MGYTSSIDTGLPAVPDLTDIQSPGKLDYQFVQLYNAMGILSQAIDAYTGNTPAGQETTNQPAEQTVLIGNTANLFCVAQADLSAGFLVTLVNVSGVTNAKLANAGLGAAGIAYGLTMTAASAGNQVQVLLIGLFTFGSATVTPGQLYYLSDTTAGGIATAPPATSGNLSQAVGYGVDTESIFFNPTLQPILVP